MTTATQAKQEKSKETIFMRNSGYINVQLSLVQSDLDYVKTRPEGVSAFVRSLVEADRAAPADYAGPPRRSTLVNSGYVTSSVLLTPAQMEYCADKPGGRTPFLRFLVSEFRRADAQD